MTEKAEKPPALFQEVRLSWGGKEYVIPADETLYANALLEDVFTLHELITIYQRGGAPVAKLSIAYAKLLRHAGALASDEDVARVFYGVGTAGSQRSAQTAVMTLMKMMIPPEHLRVEGKSGDGESSAAPSEPSTS